MQTITVPVIWVETLLDLIDPEWEQHATPEQAEMVESLDGEVNEILSQA